MKCINLASVQRKYVYGKCLATQTAVVDTYLDACQQYKPTFTNHITMKSGSGLFSYCSVVQNINLGSVAIYTIQTKNLFFESRRRCNRGKLCCRKCETVHRTTVTSAVCTAWQRFFDSNHFSNQHCVASAFSASST